MRPIGTKLGLDSEVPRKKYINGLLPFFISDEMSVVTCYSIEVGLHLGLIILG